jgi:hypothetical protein
LPQSAQHIKQAPGSQSGSVAASYPFPEHAPYGAVLHPPNVALNANIRRKCYAPDDTPDMRCSFACVSRREIRGFTLPRSLADSLLRDGPKEAVAPGNSGARRRTLACPRVKKLSQPLPDSGETSRNTDSRRHTNILAPRADTFCRCGERCNL